MFVYNESEFLPIIADGDDKDLKNIEVPDVLPILPLRNTVLFPGVVLPITVGRERSLKLIRDVNSGSKLLGTLAQKDYTVDQPEPSDLFSIGTVAEILKVDYRTVLDQIHMDQIKAIRIGKLYRITEAQLEDFLSKSST